jgi:hypothetical protein
MLTKNDLDKIGLLIDTKLEQKLEQKLKPIHTKLNKMQKMLDTTINYFDTVTTNHEKRLKRIETHLELPAEN